MTQTNPQVPWTDEQWARVNQVIQEEAQRARVAATFLPLYGPLPASADFVRSEAISYEPLRIADEGTTKLSILQLNVSVRGEQLADPEMRSVLALFRRGANVLARLEDALIFNEYAGYDPNVDDEPPELPYGAADIGEVIWGPRSTGLLKTASANEPQPKPISDGNALVDAVTDAIGDLEDNGHFGPFAVVLSQGLFSLAQKPVNILNNVQASPDGPSFVPQARIIPFLGGGSLLRSSALPNKTGLVLALGGAPIELVVATDMSLQFLHVTDDPYFIFRIFEKIVLRIKEPTASVALGAKIDQNGEENGDEAKTQASKTRQAAKKAALTKRKKKPGNT
jgi:uncharacterized linocin/CFP29 family protein